MRYRPCGPRPIRPRSAVSSTGRPDGKATGSPVLVSPADRAVDPVAAQKLWDVAEELTGVEYSFD